MPSPRVLLAGIVQNLLSGYSTDDPGSSNDQPVRLRRDRSIAVVEASPNDFLYAEEGSYFIATNPVVGTGFTWVTAQTAFSDTTPNFYIFNGEPYIGGKYIGLRFLKMIATAAATSATLIRYAFILDNQARALSTDNTATGPASPKTAGVQVHAMQGSALPANLVVKIQSSATASVIAGSSASAIVVANGTLGGLNVVGTEMQINFGQYDAGGGNSAAAAETVPSRRVNNEAPILIPPGWSLTGHIWMPGSAAAFSPEVIIGMRAR